MTRLAPVARHTTHYFLVMPRDSAPMPRYFTASRKSRDASHAHVTPAVHTRISPSPLICHGSPLLDHTSAHGLSHRSLDFSGTPSVTPQGRCQGINTTRLWSGGEPSALCVQSVV